MAIANYADLQTAVANWLKRTDLTSYIPDLITIAEAQMNRDFMNMNPPLRAMEVTTTGTLSGSSIALPTGYMGTKSFVLTVGGNNKPLKYKTPEQVAYYGQTSEPNYFSTSGDSMYFYPIPGTSYSYSWTYYKKFDPLSAGVNWIITNAPDIYLFGTLAQAEPFMKNDSRIATWVSFYQNAINSLEMANRKDRQSGSTLQMRSDSTV